MMALALVGLWACAVHAQTTLKWNFKDNPKFYLETVSTSTQSMKTVGRELKQQMEQTAAWEITVVKDDTANGGPVVLTQKLLWMIVKNGPTAPPDDRYDKQLAGDKDLIDRLAPATDEAAQKLIKAILPEDSLKEAAVEAFSYLPDKPVKPNVDTWTLPAVEKSLGPLGSVMLSRKYSYDSQATVDGKNVARLSFTGTGEYKPPKPEMAALFDFKVIKERANIRVEELKGSTSFEINDQGSGRLSKSEWSLRLKGQVTITVGGSPLETEATQDLTVKTPLREQKPDKPMTGAPGGPMER